MNVALRGGPADETPLPGVRTILVPPDIVAVARRSPAPLVRKKPPCRPRTDGGPIEKTGERKWFGDRLFVDPRRDRVRGGLGGSIGAHALVVMFVLVLAARSERSLEVKVHPRLVMPAMLLTTPIGDAPSTAPGAIQQSSAPSRRAAGAVAPPLAPVEIPGSIEPETGDEGSPSGEEDSGEGGTDGGVAGGIGTGPAGSVGSSGTASSGPLRLGNALAPPRKIKDVRPSYPQVALSAQARGTVIIEITIGTDGKVRDARVIHSAPQLDQAALQAVRQWEYEPTRVNGTLVELTMTVVVNFAVQ